MQRPLKKEYHVYYFFPFYHTGGAEKIHALIAKTTAVGDCVIFFTRKSHNVTFRKEFEESGCDIQDISRFTDNKWLYFMNLIFRGIVSGYINRQKTAPVVFNGQCNFGYKISPWVRKDIRQVELIHSLNTFSYIRIPFLPFIAATVMISKLRIEQHVQLYQRYGIPGFFVAKIHYISNASDFEQYNLEDKDFSCVRVFYSGRATPEKRPHLVTAIAEKVRAKDGSIEFVMAGDDFRELQTPALDFIHFRGNIGNKQVLHQIYRDCNVLLITSSTEGFPLAVIEGMAYGCAIIATPVGDIPFHVKPNEQGFLFSTIDDEPKIIEEGVAFILQLKANKELHKSISATNIRYAAANFTLHQFGEAYKKLIYT
jgi:glycosyltransferase involved in cell wall biosynthesis